MEPEINLIPFIDVLLVVLIFLMLSTRTASFTELQLKLPVADADAQRDYVKEVIVAVSSDGRYSIRGYAGARPPRGSGRASADRGGPRRQGQRGDHQCRRGGAAPIRDHCHGSGTPFGPDARSRSLPSPRRTQREPLGMTGALQHAWLRRGALARLLFAGCPAVSKLLASLRRGGLSAWLASPRPGGRAGRGRGATSSQAAAIAARGYADGNAPRARCATRPSYDR